MVAVNNRKGRECLWWGEEWQAECQTEAAAATARLSSSNLCPG